MFASLYLKSRAVAFFSFHQQLTGSCFPSYCKEKDLRESIIIWSKIRDTDDSKNLIIFQYKSKRGPRGSEVKLHERYYSLSFPNINLAF
jgi:hypothetical protein